MQPNQRVSPAASVTSPASMMRAGIIQGLGENIERGSLILVRMPSERAMSLPVPAG